MTQASSGTGFSTRILIMSASFGGPHRGIADALAAYYREHYPQDVDVRVVDFFDEFMPQVGVLARFAYTQHDRFFPAGSGSLVDMLEAPPGNAVVDELKAGAAERIAEFVETAGADAVISVAPVADTVVTGMRPRPEIVSATVFTDYQGNGVWLDPSTDLYFVPCTEVRDDLVVRGAAWDRIVTSGLPVDEAFAVPTPRTSCRKTLGLAERFTVLFSDGAGSVGDVRRSADELAASGIQVSVMTGSNRRLRSRLESLAQTQPLVQVFGYSQEMNKMMRAADVFVGRAGDQALSEAMATGLPVIVSDPVPGQERGNVDFLVNCGAGLAARDQADVAEKVRFLSTHPDRLEQMGRNAQRLGKPTAAASVCERVLAAVR